MVNTHIDGKFNFSTDRYLFTNLREELENSDLNPRIIRKLMENLDLNPRIIRRSWIDGIVICCCF